NPPTSRSDNAMTSSPSRRCGHPKNPSPRRHGALLRDAGCVFADDCGLVYRRPHTHQLGRRCPADGVLATATAAGHDLSWQPGQYTSWAFGQRLRQAGLLGSMGRVASVDNAMIESFWSTM